MVVSVWGSVRFLDAEAAASSSEPPLVLIELFTSQGCSSCPPADAWLSKIGQGAQGDRRVVALAYHVDYWDNLGWVDPFSHAHWTQRQQRYDAVVFRTPSIYTPQLIVNGKYQCLGSDGPSVMEAIRTARAVPRCAELALAGRWIGEGSQSIEVEVSGDFRPSATSERYALMMAIFENACVTEVLRGENAHRTLRNDYVVRRLNRGEDVSPSASRFHQILHQEVSPDWKADRLGVAVFLQDPMTMEIGATGVQILHEVSLAGRERSSSRP